MDEVIGILTLSELEYLDESWGEKLLRWTIPSARVGLPVAFVGKAPSPGQGQVVCSLGFVKGITSERFIKKRISYPLWWCEDVVWLKHPLFQTDLGAKDRQRLRTFGGFASYRLQGLGAGIRSIKQWSLFIDILTRQNPRMRLDVYKTQRVLLKR